MALLQNGFRDASAGVRIFGATQSNNAYPVALQSNTDKAGLKRNIFTAEGYSAKAGIPAGHLHPSSWMLPQKPGGLSSHSEAIGVASWSGAIAAGRNIAATFAGAATFTGRLSSAPVLNGTSTASDLYLNMATSDDVTSSRVVTVTGWIIVTWINGGDNTIS